MNKYPHINRKVKVLYDFSIYNKKGKEIAFIPQDTIGKIIKITSAINILNMGWIKVEFPQGIFEVVSNNGQVEVL